MTTYVLLVSIITSYGAVSTQRETGFSSYQDCEAEAVARIESQPLNPDSRIRWSCQRDRDDADLTEPGRAGWRRWNPAIAKMPCSAPMKSR